MLGALRSLTWRLATGKGVASLRAVAQPSIPAALTAGLDDAQPLAGVDDPVRLRRLGDQLLRLYFAQWTVEDGLFLDLRSARLGARGDELVFAPNGLWIRLRPEFRQGMLALYRSFYSDDAGAFRGALRAMGLLPDDLPADEADRLVGLLRNHFGVDQSEQRFSIDDFKRSFDELFEFFLANDYKLHSDFVFVGFYLVTLYLTLEQGGQAHDVRSICSEVLLEHPPGADV